MNTVVPKIYLDKIMNLAEKFALANCIQDKNSKEYNRSYIATYRNYYNISIYLYIRLNKISRNPANWNFNRIPSSVLKKFTCKLYKKIVEDLVKNQIIVKNNHYSNFKNNRFSKSYLIHRSLLNTIRKTKEKLKYELVEIEIPERVLDLLGTTYITNQDDFLFVDNKLNSCYGRKEQEKIKSIDNFYSELKYDENELDKYTETDEFAFNRLKKELTRLKCQPKFIKGRFYHEFHQLPKDFREKVLTLDGEHLVEAFDIHGSDLHMLAKILEDKKYGIPAQELEKFQRAVKSDFRTLFGQKKNGKCTAYVKRAFKIYLNTKKSNYYRLRQGSIAWKIDEYFDVYFPTIRQYIRSRNDIWLTTMNEEFEVVSVDMISELKKQGIKALSCHDAIYLKQSDVEKMKGKIEDLFYDKLDLRADRMDKFFNL